MNFKKLKLGDVFRFLHWNIRDTAIVTGTYTHRNSCIVDMYQDNILVYTNVKMDSNFGIVEILSKKSNKSHLPDFL